MDPGDILRRGRTNASEGRHAQALVDYLWFHKNALKHDRAYYGVRLSFALAYWKELSDVYPPAAAAMKTVRAETAAALLKADGNTRTLFDEVAAIDLELGFSPETYKIFRSLMKKDPDQARKCADLALPSIVEAEDYNLATKFLPHPRKTICCTKVSVLTRTWGARFCRAGERGHNLMHTCISTARTSNCFCVCWEVLVRRRGAALRWSGP
jgi:hypothetical protein